MENKSINKKSVCTLIGISLAVILLMGLTYAWLTQVLNGTKINRITAGTLELTLDDNATDGIDLEYAIPQSNEQGLSNTAYTFTVKNTGSINAAYKLYLEDEEIEGTRIDDSNIKYNLVKNSEEDNPKLLSTTIDDNKRILENTIIDGNSTDTYSLKLWIDSEATQSEVANKVFKARIKLEAVQTDNSSNDKYQITARIIKDEDPQQCDGGSVVIYPGGTTVTVDSECKFTIPEADYGEHTIYYVPSGVDPNKTEDELKDTPGVIPGRIVVNPGTQEIHPAQGYTIILDIIKKSKPTYKYINSHIKGLYAYDEEGTGVGSAYTGCLGGEEAGCEDIKEKVSSNPSTLPVGTIVKYEVKPGEELYFNVLYDNGDTLTMQSTDNTFTAVRWYGTDTSTRSTKNGPSLDYDYALYDIEVGTSGWAYVNDQTYTLGQTVFGTGEFATANTGCDADGYLNAASCKKVHYPLLTRTNVKARMITGQEASEMGCQKSVYNSCKKFMHNYLYKSKTYNATFTAEDEGYWTSSVDSTSTYIVHNIVGGGRIGSNNSHTQQNGVRPVVVVNK